MRNEVFPRLPGAFSAESKKGVRPGALTLADASLNTVPEFSLLQCVHETAIAAVEARN